MLSAARASKDAGEDAGLAPAHEAVVERLVWAILGWRVAPSQPVAQNVDDARDHTPVIDSLHPSGLVGQQRLEAGKLLLRKSEMMCGHHILLCLGDVESCQPYSRNTPFIDPEPSLGEDTG